MTFAITTFLCLQCKHESFFQAADKFYRMTLDFFQLSYGSAVNTDVQQNGAPAMYLLTVFLL